MSLSAQLLMLSTQEVISSQFTLAMRSTLGTPPISRRPLPSLEDSKQEKPDNADITMSRWKEDCQGYTPKRLVSMLAQPDMSTSKIFFSEMKKMHITAQ